MMTLLWQGTVCQIQIIPFQKNIKKYFQILKHWPFKRLVKCPQIRLSCWCRDSSLSLITVRNDTAISSSIISEAKTFWSTHTEQTSYRLAMKFIRWQWSSSLIFTAGWNAFIKLSVYRILELKLDLNWVWHGKLSDPEQWSQIMVSTAPLHTMVSDHSSIHHWHPTICYYKCVSIFTELWMTDAAAAREGKSY